MPFIDISSAIFQQSQSMRVIEVQYEFIDVGRFEEIYELNDKDVNGNVIIGDVILESGCNHNLIINKTTTPLVIINKQNTVIVQTNEGGLVSSFTDSFKIGVIYKTQIHGHDRQIA